MKSSCLKTAFVLISTLVAASSADVMPPNHHAVARLFGISNADEFPEKVFIAWETQPGATMPTAAYRLRSKDWASLGYKFNRLEIYSAKASDWNWMHESLGIADGLDRNGSGGVTGKGWELGSGGANRKVWTVGDRVVLTQIEGDVEASPGYVSDGNPLISERYGYTFGDSEIGGALVLARVTSSYSDGRAEETRNIPLRTVDILPGGAIGKEPLQASFSPDRRSLRLIPGHGGVSRISLYNSRGQRILESRRNLVAGSAHSLALPSLASGRYLVSIEGLGGRQALWLDY